MEQQIDRRGRPRVRSAGTATVQRGNTREKFALRDLSPSGARLVGTARLVEGEPVSVTLELDGVTLALIAEVVRTDPQNSQAAIAFRGVSREAVVAIERAIERIIERARATALPGILVLHPDATVRAALERDISRLDRATTPCAAPLELVWAMQETTARHDALVVSDSPREVVAEILEYFARHYPTMRRILLFGEQLGSIDHSLSSRVDSVLRTPWRIRSLARALGVSATDSSIAMIPLSEDAEP